MSKRSVYGIILTLLLTNMLTFAFNIQLVKALSTTLSVTPTYTVVGVGKTFVINITVTDVVDLFAWQIKLFFNSTVLNSTDAWYPSDHVFAGKTFIEIVPSINNEEGFVMYGSSLLGLQPGFSGSGTLCQIEFRFTKSGSSSLDFSRPYGDNTLLFDSYLDTIPADLEDGFVTTGTVETSVFFNIYPNPATAGQIVTLKGILVDESSNPLANEDVALYLFAGTWIPITILTTNNYGIFTWQVTIPSITGMFIFAVYYPGSEVYESTYNFALLIIL